MNLSVDDYLHLMQQWAAPFSFVDELMEDGGSPHRKERPQTEDDLTSQGVVSTNQAHALSTMYTPLPS